MHDDGARRRIDDSDLVKHGSGVGADEHHEAVVELEDADRVGVGMQDVLVADSMLAGAGAMTGSALTTTS